MPLKRKSTSDVQQAFEVIKAQRASLTKEQLTIALSMHGGPEWVVHRTEIGPQEVERILSKYCVVPDHEAIARSIVEHPERTGT
jgi:hypothetical protein